MSKNLIEKLAVHDWAVNLAVARELAQAGDKALPVLIEALGSEDAYVRAAAAHALKLAPQPEAYEALLAALGDTRPGVTDDGEAAEALAEVALALGALGDRRACDALLTALAAYEEQFLCACWYILDALGMLGCAQAIPAVERLVDHWDIDMRKTSRRVLALLRSS